MENTKGSRLFVRIPAYVIGLLIMTLGVAISVKSNLGVSPVSSIPYTITCVVGLEMGKATILFHAVLVLLQILLLRRAFQAKNLLQIFAGILFGYFTTFCNSLMVFFPDPTNLIVRLAMMLFSTGLIAFGLFWYVPADIIPLAGEGAMLAISRTIKKPFPTVKIAFDVTMVVISLITCLICLHSLGSVGIGTIAAAILVGMELRWITKKCGAQRDAILGVTKKETAQSPLLAIMKQEVYTVSEETSIRDALRLITEKKISGEYATEAETFAAIKDFYEKTGYVMDTHTAVAYAAYQKYKAESGDNTPMVIVSTASPYKFTKDVMTALDAKYKDGDAFALQEDLERISGVAVPAPIVGLEHRPILHKNVCEKTEIKDVVKNWLK